MTEERYHYLNSSEAFAEEKCQITPEELKEGWHYCYEFDGLLRNNNEEDFKCDCHLI